MSADPPLRTPRSALLTRQFAYLVQVAYVPPRDGWGDRLHKLLLPGLKHFDATRFGLYLTARRGYPLSQCPKCRRRRLRLNRLQHRLRAASARLTAQIRRALTPH